VLGLVLGYGVNEIKNFILSFREHNQQDCINLVMDQPTLDRTRDFLKSQNVDFTLVDLHYETSPTPVNNLRYNYYESIITSGNYKHILLSDIRDVVFQKNPFVNLPEDQYLYLFQEDSGVPIGEEMYNSMWIKMVYGDQIFDQIKKHLVICSGTVMGSPARILEYVNLIIHDLNKVKERSPDVWKQNVLDQAPGMYLVYAKEQKIQGLEIKPSGHIVGTIGLSVYHDLAQDRIKGYAGVVYVNDLMPAVIHQYDRQGELLAFFNQKYSISQF
jgi:hypothetical protein